MTNPILTTARLACILSTACAFSPSSSHQRYVTSLNNEFDGFNPFTPGSKLSNNKESSGILTVGAPSSTSTTTPGGILSPRSIKMKEITTLLLDCISDPEAVQTLLLQNEDFLMEQLNNDDVVFLEQDSIFTPDMSRRERFERYREVISERIGGARVPAARKALTALMEFVLSRE